MVRRDAHRGALTVATLASLALLVGLAGCAGPEEGLGPGTDATSDAPAGEVVEVPGHPVLPDSLAISADGTRVAAGCRDDLCVWDTANGTLVGQWDGGRVVAFGPDGAIATDGFDANRSTVVLLDADGEEQAELPGHATESEQDGTGNGIAALAFSPDGETLASAGPDGTVRLWTVDGQPIAAIETASDEPDALAFSPDGSRLAVAGPEAPVEVVDTAGGGVVGTLGDESQGAVAWSPDGSLIATTTRAAGPDARGRLWDAASLAEADSGFAPEDADMLAFSPDGTEIAVTVKGSGNVELWPVADGEVATLTGHRDDPRGVVWAPDGRTLYTASSSEGVLAWDPAGGQPVRFDLPRE